MNVWLLLLGAIAYETVPAGPGALAPRLTPTPDGLALSWLEPTDAGTHRLRLSQRTDGGWSGPVTITESSRLLANWADGPSVLRAPSGTWLAHFGERQATEGHAVDVAVARSPDGRSWQRLGTVHDDGTASEHGFVSLLGEAPEPLAIWLDGRETVKPGGAMTLRAATIADGGMASGAVLDDRVCDCCGTGAAVTRDGPLVVYRDRSADEVRDIWAVRRVKGRWSKPQRVAADGWKIPGCPVNGPAVAALGSSAAVAWYTYADSQPRVRVAFSKDSGASFGRALDVDAAFERSAPIGRVGVVLEPEGTALVSWVAADRENARVMVRRVSPAGLAGDAVTVADTKSDRQSGFPRIELWRDDLFVAWTSRSEATRIELSRVPTAEIPAAKVAPTARKPAEPVTPSVAPATQVSTLDGKPVSLDSLRGRVVVLNFWATWCEPCRSELPELVALAGRHRARGLEVVGVSVDRDLPGDKIRAFAERRKVTFPLWRDPDETLASALGVTQLPATFLIDAEGRIVWSARGAISAADPRLASALEKALRR